jgi:hypothetical protein
MRRVGVVWLMMVASGLAVPNAASSQLVRPSDRAAVSDAGDDVGYAAGRLAPTPSSIALLGPLPQPRTVSPEEWLQPLPALPQEGARSRGGMPLMIAGGALFVAGLIAGGDAGTILMIGGGAVGAYGLYLYF